MNLHYHSIMLKSSFLTGLLNSDKKNIAEYLATWDDLNVFFKTLDKGWDLVSQIWKSKREINKDNATAFQNKVDEYLNSSSKFDLQVLLFERFLNLFEIGTEKISSQKELDDIACELERKAISFQKEFSHDFSNYL